ncbi:MAG: ABC transporter permease [Oceanicaulis sp.]
MISVLDRKLWRDFRTLRGQALAIALVIAGGVAVHLVMGGMLASLDETRAAYYERTRFADIWAPAVRAPQALIEDVREIEGVAAAETRVTAPVLFDMPGMAEPATGTIHSLPRGRPPGVNDIYLSAGSRPSPDRPGDVVVLQSFADAHGLGVGDTIRATIRGRQETLSISGLALSPEYVYAIAPGQLVPEARLFGVLWMDRQALETAAEQKGAFNEVVVRLSRGADPAPVRAALDRILEPYGGSGAYTRREQISDSFLSSEINQLQTMGDVLPPVFLAVAAFLVNIVISRLIAVERAQIGLMKAFGYASREVAVHYLKLVGLIAALGLAIGFALGIWLGREMAVLYTQFYDFPFLIFAATPGVWASGVLVTLAAVGFGAAWSVSRAARLVPAVAMRAPPPPDYSRGLGAAAGGLRALDQQTRMIVRQLLRWPVRATLTVVGIAASAMTLVASLYFNDAMDVMIASYFDVSNRHDMAVFFVEARSMSAFYELAGREGVIEAEPFRQAGARLQFQNREVIAPLTGAPEDARLARMIASDGSTVAPPPGGLVLSRDLADRLGAAPGDVVHAQITEGERPLLALPITATPRVLIGSGAQMRLDDLNAALGQSRSVSGGYLRVDPEAAERIYLELKDAPLVGAVQLHRLAKTNFQALIQRSMGSTIFVYSIFAGMIALGVVYNAIRVSLAERERELASLRVLGFSKADVSYLLLGEAALLMLIAVPLGLIGGTGMAWIMGRAMESDFFRLPFVITPYTYGYSALLLFVIAAASALVVRRRLDRLDLVSALKNRE